jgi:hypothetical protein
VPVALGDDSAVTGETVSAMACARELAIWPPEIEALVRTLRGLEIEAEICNPGRAQLIRLRIKQLTVRIEAMKTAVFVAEAATS